MKLIRNLHVYIFVVLIFLFSMCNLMISPSGEQFKAENRNMSPKPVFSFDSLFSGNYFREFEDYFSDSFMFRFQAIRFSKRLSALRGISSDTDIEIHYIQEDANAEKTLQDYKEMTRDNNRMEAAGPVKNAEPEKTGQQAAAEPGKNMENENRLPAEQEPGTGTITPADYNMSEETWGKLLIVENKGMGINEYAPEASQGLASVINDFADRYPQVKFYALMSPTQVEFIDKKYQSLSYPEDKTINLFYASLNSRVEPVDVLPKLSEKRDEYVFFATDHHWTARGAYYAYTVFMEQKGEPSHALEEYEKVRYDNYLGSYYTMTLSDKLLKNPDYVEAFLPLNSHLFTIYDENWNEASVYDNVIEPDFIADNPDKYYIFMDGNQPLIKITTEIKNNKKILLFKDSFANSFMPFLISHYEEIYAIDPRYLSDQLDELINGNNISEIMFLNNALRTNNRVYEDLLRALLKMQN